MRKARVERRTNETAITVSLEIDGRGESEIRTGIGFFDHLLGAFSKHGLFDLTISAKGDLQVDDHHTVEDVGIALGTAFSQALGDKKGINRFGNFRLPMDEALAEVSIDLSGRSGTVFRASFAREKIGSMSTETGEEFFRAFSRACGCTVHASVPYGTNDHHKLEALFKAFGRALKEACAIDARAGGRLQTTKGSL